MYQTWEEIREQYPDQWVVLINAKFKDIFHMDLLGGVVFSVAEDQEAMFQTIPMDDGREFVCQHTNEGVQEGVLKSCP